MGQYELKPSSERACFSSGYISEGFLTQLPQTAENLYPTKDQVRVDQGDIEYLGRIDRTVKIRGQRINLDQIEQVACATGITSAACAWVDESQEGQKLHLAYVETDRGTAGSGLQLRIGLSNSLPSYSVPNVLHSFTDFPLNGNGKPHRDLIRQRAESE